MQKLRKGRWRWTLVGVCASCPTNPVWLVYQQPLPYGLGGEASPAMDQGVRLRIWVLCLADCVLIVLGECLGIFVHPFLRPRTPAPVFHV